LKTRLDTAALAGATAALSAPSRARFDQAVTNLRSADAECSSLRTAAQTRHVEAKDEAERAAQVASEAEQKRATFRDDLKQISGARRASIEERLAKLWGVGYVFAYYAYNDPARPATANYGALPPLAVLPTLADKGRLAFGRNDGYNRVSAAGARVITSGGELEELVDAFMGRDPTD
jgi:predicted flap endonuclease-1-like 5' DNA nuclease